MLTGCSTHPRVTTNLESRLPHWWAERRIKSWVTFYEKIRSPKWGWATNYGFISRQHIYQEKLWGCVATCMKMFSRVPLKHVSTTTHHIMWCSNDKERAQISFWTPLKPVHLTPSHHHESILRVIFWKKIPCYNDIRQAIIVICSLIAYFSILYHLYLTDTKCAAVW